MAQQFGQESTRYPDTSKIVVYKNDLAGLKTVETLKVRATIDYPDRKVFIVDKTDPQFLRLGEKKKITVQDEMNKIYINDRVIDTTKQSVSPAEAMVEPSTLGDLLYLIQFAGPIKDEWLNEVKKQGSVKFITSIPSNAYLIWTDGPTLKRLYELSKSKLKKHNFLQWLGPYKPELRIPENLQTKASESTAEALMAAKEAKEVKVTVQFVAHDHVGTNVDLVRKEAKIVINDAWAVGPYINLRVTLPVNKLQEIVSLPDVVRIERWVEPKPFGERQGQILADQFNAQQSQPIGPGYLKWLYDKGFSSTFDFLVNVSDTGIDRGKTEAAALHPDFLDVTGQSRVAYVQEVRDTTISDMDSDNNDTAGHGTIDHAIVGGFNNKITDAAGYHYGLGIAPFVRLGSSRIFKDAESFTNPNHKVLTNAAYIKGARISSNSWGSTFGTSAYDTTSEEYDRLVRDARPSTLPDGGEPGNQEMVIVWAAGNEGLGGASTLGDTGATAKNTIVVGASENWTVGGSPDYCGPSMDARNIVPFSSRGPTKDGRFKPDLVAPGSRIFGAASQDPKYDGTGTCGPVKYYPPGQTFYTLSSGTSHATPAVAGAAALLRQWFLNQGRPAPSPAMTKAYLMNSATYMRGIGGNDTLPSSNQGMGRLNLERAFDNVPRILVDQTEIFKGTGETRIVKGKICNSTVPFRVTLAWTDAPGANLVNNLDLEVTITDGNQPGLYRGNIFQKDDSQPGGKADTVNNVESVWLPAGAKGNFAVTVRAFNITGDGVPNNDDETDQDYALVIYNADTGKQPVVLKLLKCD